MIDDILELLEAGAFFLVIAFGILIMVAIGIGVCATLIGTILL